MSGLKPRVLLADDHKIVLEGLRGLLGDQFDLVGFATNGRELITQAAALRPDVIVADISMPLLNGIEAVRKLLEDDKHVKVVFLTMHPDQTYASRALEAGASAYVLKHSASDELVAAIHEVLRGGKFVSESLKNEALSELLNQTRRHLKETIELTGRQREVLQLLVEGKSAKEIAAVLNISPRTVETHKYQMMDDLGVKTSAQLVQYAIRHGLASE
ncbi:MAG TPA: response regulator transcription factor [Bryobacteraceae bacterium]|nr:response regulator transcription factor [Bryobacteraceae bacterium]